MSAPAPAPSPHDDLSAQEPGSGARPRVVVGVDGSACSAKALTWALQQAVLLHADVDAGDLDLGVIAEDVGEAVKGEVGCGVLGHCEGSRRGSWLRVRGQQLECKR